MFIKGLFYTYGMFEVVVLDDNDNAPVFSKNIYELHVWPQLKKNVKVGAGKLYSRFISHNRILFVNDVGTFRHPVCASLRRLT